MENIALQMYLVVNRNSKSYKKRKLKDAIAMRLIIDGDGSPVKEEVIYLGEKFQLTFLIVTSIDHYTNKEEPPFVHFVYVDKGADRADYEIIKLVEPDDIVITQDYGLASLALPKGARVFHHSGEEYKKETIDILLNKRYMSAQMRKAGKKTKGPKAFTQKDREHFFAVLDEALKKELDW